MGFKRPEKKPKTTDDEKDKRPEVVPIKFTQLFRYITKFQILMYLVGGLAAGGVGAALPITSIFFGKMVDAFTDFQQRKIDADQFQQVVNENALYFVYLALGVFILTYVYMSCYIYVGGRLVFEIRKNYLKATLRQQISWFDSLGSGEVATRITTDTNLVQDGISEKIALLVQDITTFISGFVIAFTADWKLTLVVLCIIPALVITIGFLTFFATKFVTQTLTYYGDAGSLVEETVTSIKTVLAFNQQAKLTKLYSDNLGKAEKAGLKKAFSVGVGVGCIFLFIYCGYSLAFYFGGTLILDNLTQSGKVVNVFFAILIGAFSLSNVAPNIQALSFAKGAGAKLFEAIDNTPLIDIYSESGSKLEKVVGKLELKNIKFSYPSRSEVEIFNDFSLSIEPGTTVALVGASGSGKSTVIQLLERFYDPVQGSVQLDGVNLTKINLKWLRQQIGLVSQEPTLFSGSIAYNVALGLIGTQYEHQSIEDQLPMIEEACKLANAHEFIIELQDKYSTQVGERGFLLSGGQKQRIAIARAIVKDPKILLLDEATSALDSRSEAVVQDALDKASKNRTTVTIAHRLSTIKDADLIVVMDKGTVVEKGTHKQLIELDANYNRLIKLQEVNYQQNESNTPQELSLIKKLETIQSIDLEQGQTIDPSQEKALSRSGLQLALKVFKINASEKHLYLLGTLGAVALGLVYPIFAIIFSEILTVFLKTGQELRDGTNFWALMFLVIAIGAGIATFFQIGFFGIAAEKLTTRLRIRAFQSIINQEPGWFDRSDNTTGALTSKLSTEAQDIQGLSGVTLGTLAQTFTNLVGSIIVGLVYGWKLALVITATLPLLIGAGYLQITVSTMFQESNKKAYNQSAELACEAVASVKTVASLTREHQVVDLYVDSMQVPLKSSKHNAFVASLAFSAAQSMNFLVNGLGFWYGATLFRQGEYDYTQFFAVFMALVVGAGGIGRSFAYGPDISKAKSAASSLFHLLERQPLISSQVDSTKKQPKSIEGKVEFSDVHFRYPTRLQHKVLKGVDFTVLPGQFVALVGPSGCGKSTTISLIERFYDLTQGSLKIDGVDIRDYSLPHLRDFMSLVSQEPSLYNLTIAENIAFGAKLDQPSPSQQTIEDAAKLANIHDFIQTLPEKYNTKVGNKGSQLSGGQKQRIAIARALLRNPKILLLDEATSALDADSEKEVQLALDKAKLGRTTIAIAHRLSTIQNADLILVFNKGKIVERGTHNQLVELRGFYYKMVSEQVLVS